MRNRKEVWMVGACEREKKIAKMTLEIQLWIARAQQNGKHQLEGYLLQEFIWVLQLRLDNDSGGGQKWMNL